MAISDASRVLTNSQVSLVYFGTPEYAVASLQALVADPRYDVRLVVTQPDRQSGRGHRATPPPVKIAAAALGVQVYQPASLRSTEARRPLIEIGAEVFVVAAYGLIFGKRTLAIPPKGCVNLHASLLPRYRGASPVAAAILAGERETGVSLMQMDTGIDTGPVWAKVEEPVLPEDTTASLTQRLARAGAELVAERLWEIVRGVGAPAPQPATGATLTRMLTKADGEIDWHDDAVVIERQVRAMWPWPRAWTMVNGQPLQVHHSRVVEAAMDGEVGVVESLSCGPVVPCGRGELSLEMVQPAGGKAMSGKAWIAGHQGRVVRLGDASGRVPRPPLVVPVD
jgi:methionyl-tRNA formyltransferase